MFDTYEAIFAQRADAYQSAMQRWPDARAAEFAAMTAPLGALGGRMLIDLPAGGGYLARHLPADCRYVAVEPTPLFLSFCPEGPARERVLAPIEQVPLADGAADAVVSLAGLHHAPDLDAIFREMRRLARAAGRVVIADADADSPVARFLNGFVDRHNPMGHDGRFLDGATAGRLAAAGLAIEEDRACAMPWRFASARAAGEFAGLLFGLEGVDADDIAAALDADIGLAAGGGGVALAWSLRRIVCCPA